MWVNYTHDRNDSVTNANTGPGDPAACQLCRKLSDVHRRSSHKQEWANNVYNRQLLVTIREVQHSRIWFAGDRDAWQQQFNYLRVRLHVYMSQKGFSSPGQFPTLSFSETPMSPEHFSSFCHLASGAFVSYRGQRSSSALLNVIYLSVDQQLTITWLI